MDTLTKNVSRYIRKKGISIKKISEGTGIPYAALYDSLLHKSRNRELRADEFMAICKFLEKKPEDFAEEDAS